MKQVSLMPLLLGLCLAMLSAWKTATAQAAELPILAADPLCVTERLGRVRVTLGEGRPDPHHGGLLRGVSYARAFTKLTAAAAERDADAVVLREHEADYFAKGSRRPSRPTYVMLAGAAIRLKAASNDCALSTIDPAEFERSALERNRENVAGDAGVSF